MPLELTAEEVSSLNSKAQIDGSALIKLLAHYVNGSASVYDIASSIHTLQVQLERIKENPIGKHLIVLHVSALDRGYEGIRNHYVGLIIERGAGAGGVYKVSYIDPMGRIIDGSIQAIIDDKLGIDDIDCYRGRLQYAEEVSTGGVRSFKEGNNDYDCGPILIYLLTKAIHTEELLSLANLEEGVAVRESIRIGKELRDIFRGDNGKRIEDSVDLAEYSGKDRRTIYANRTAAATAARTFAGRNGASARVVPMAIAGRTAVADRVTRTSGGRDGGGGSGSEAAISAATSAAREVDTGAGASIRAIDDAGNVRAEAVSEKEAVLRQRLRKLVLEEPTIGLLEEDASKNEKHKKKQEIAQVFLELSRLYLEEVEADSTKEEESKEVATKRRANKLNEAVMFANYAISIAERCIQEVSESVTASRVVKELDIATIKNFEAVIKQSYRAIESIQTSLYKIVEAQAPVSTYYRTGRDRAKLERLRQYCKDKLAEIEKEYERIKVEGLEKEEDSIGGVTKSKDSEEEINLRLAEEYEIREVRSLYENIAGETKGLIATIVRECEEVLGPPPCRYAVIGLGSLALSQFTPYSDLEFAILMDDQFDERRYAAERELLALSTRRSELLEVEDKVIALEKEKKAALERNERNKQYFRNLSQLIHFRIINLGESVIPYSKFELPLDQYIRRGISFDLGSKTSLGRQDKSQYELIQTPHRMARYLDHKVWSKIDKNLPYILEAVVHIAGDTAITADYQIRVRAYFYAIDPEASIPNHQVKAYKRLKEGIGEYSGKFIGGDIDVFRPQLDAYHDEGRLFDVKQEIYRLPDRLIYDLTTYFGVIPESAWNATEQLQRMRVIDTREDVKDATHHLLRAITYTTSLRLSIYSHYGEQNDIMIVSGLTKEGRIKSHSEFRFHIPKLEKLFKYYYIAIPMQNKLSITDFSQSQKLILSLHGLYDESDWIKAQIYARLLQYNKACDIAKGMIDSEFEKLAHEKKEKGILVGLALNDLENKLTYFISWLSQAGKENLVNEYRKKFSDLTKNGIGILVPKRSGLDMNPILRFFRHNEAIKLNNEAGFLVKEGKFKEAFKAYKQAEEIYCELFGYESIYFANTLANHAAACFACYQNNSSREVVKEALDKSNQAKGIVLGIIDKDFNNVEANMILANIHNTIGGIHKANLCYRDAKEQYNKAFLLYSRFFDPYHPHLLGIYQNIILIESEFDPHSSIHKFQTLLGKTKSRYGEKFPLAISIMHNLGNILIKIGHHNDAERILRDAYKIINSDKARVKHTREVRAIVRDIIRAITMQGNTLLLASPYIPGSRIAKLEAGKIYNRAIPFYEVFVEEKYEIEMIIHSVLLAYVESAYNNENIYEAMMHCKAVCILCPENSMFKEKYQELEKMQCIEEKLFAQYSKDNNRTRYKFHSGISDDDIRKYFSDILKEEVNISDDGNGQLEVILSDLTKSKLAERFEISKSRNKVYMKKISPSSISGHTTSALRSTLTFTQKLEFPRKSITEEEELHLATVMSTDFDRMEQSIKAIKRSWCRHVDEITDEVQVPGEMKFNGKWREYIEARRDPGTDRSHGVG